MMNSYFETFRNLKYIRKQMNPDLTELDSTEFINLFVLRRLFNLSDNRKILDNFEALPFDVSGLSVAVTNLKSIVAEPTLSIAVN